MTILKSIIQYRQRVIGAASPSQNSNATFKLRFNINGSVLKCVYINPRVAQSMINELTFS